MKKSTYTFAGLVGLLQISVDHYSLCVFSVVLCLRNILKISHLSRDRSNVFKSSEKRVRTQNFQKKVVLHKGVTSLQQINLLKKKFINCFVKKKNPSDLDWGYKIIYIHLCNHFKNFFQCINKPN